ncbi:MAG: cell division protein FtsA, cell division protein FtsA [Parcubacteria group bacterium]|nr:cell division protein FtsA, cell division protein FtsA [Parcubacteria group bacterium]
MARQIAAGIDIGTYQVKAVIAEELQSADRVTHKIIGRGTAESRGMHHGYITSSEEVSSAISEAINQAEKTAGQKVKRAFVSIGGIGLSGIISTASILISRADLEVTERDKEEALRAAEAAIPQSLTQNRKIINTIPVEYKVDGKPVWGRVEGMKAQKLEVKALFITCLEHHLEDLIRAVELSGIEVIDIVAAPIAASFVTLTKRQKKAGCLLANIGAETLSIVVFENGIPVSLEVFPIGSTDITNDIALGLKIPLDEAENVKIGASPRTSFSKKKLDEIITARLKDCFEMIEAHLKKINRQALLPAGIMLTGGGSGLALAKDLAEETLKLPSAVAEVHFGSEPSKGRESIWATAYGLAILGFNAEDEQGSVGIKPLDKIRRSGKRGLRTLSDWFGKFLP